MLCLFWNFRNDYARVSRYLVLSHIYTRTSIESYAIIKSWKRNLTVWDFPQWVKTNVANTEFCSNQKLNYTICTILFISNIHEISIWNIIISRLIQIYIWTNITNKLWSRQRFVPSIKHSNKYRILNILQQPNYWTTIFIYLNTWRSRNT